MAEKKKPKDQGLLDQVKEFYIVDYRKLLVIPVVLTLFSVFMILFTYMQTGDFIMRDVTLKGGVSVTVHTNADIDTLEDFLDGRFPDASMNFRTLESGGTTTGFIVEASDIDEDALVNALGEHVSMDDYSVETMGSALGASFFRQMFVALLFAFILMGIVFHLYFRNIYVTGAALISAFLDIFITVGIMNFLGVRLTAGGIAAYLMLIGYSIDTSILLSTKLIKEKGPLRPALFGAMKTGLTMSAAGIAAVGISYILATNVTLSQIMLILIVGLLADVVTTWVVNASLLRRYLGQ